MIKLTITHLTILAPTNAREDGLIVRPPSLKPAVAAKLAAKLIEHGLVRELRAKDEMPIWRIDGDKAFSLKLLKAGRIAVETAERAQMEIGATTNTSAASIDARSTDAGIRAEPLAASDGANGADEKATHIKSEIVTRSTAAPKPPRAAIDAVAPASTARAGSKRDKVIGMLRRPNGASVAELIAATGWLPHTTRAALSGLRKGDLTPGALPGRRAHDALPYCGSGGR